MLVNYLTTRYGKLIDQGWGAYEVGNFEKAEELFRNVLDHEDDPHIHDFEVIEAHNGIAAINLHHKDMFEASRWYKEAYYLLDTHFHTHWPKELDWKTPHERAAMRALIGLGHVAYFKGDLAKAQQWYERLLHSDKQDELGVTHYLEAIKNKKKFEQA